MLKSSVSAKLLFDTLVIVFFAIINNILLFKIIINLNNNFCTKMDRKTKTKVSGIISYLILHSHFSPLRDIETQKRAEKNQGKIREIYPGLVISDSSRI